MFNLPQMPDHDRCILSASDDAAVLRRDARKIQRLDDIQRVRKRSFRGHDALVKLVNAIERAFFTRQRADALGLALVTAFDQLQIELPACVIAAEQITGKQRFGFGVIGDKAAGEWQNGVP